MAAVKKQAQAQEQHPDVWIPTESGDKLMGEVVDLDWAWSDAKNGWYPLVSVDVEPGRTIRWHAFEKVAEGEVMKREPKIGEQVTVVFLGVSENPKPGYNPAKLFKLTVHGRDPEEATRNFYARVKNSPTTRVERQTQAQEPAPAPAQQSLPVDDGSDHPF